jgi:hypothetical protein
VENKENEKVLAAGRKKGVRGDEMNEAVNTSFLKKLSNKRNILIFAGILAVAVVHSVVQLSFIQSENSRELTAAIENALSEELSTEIKQPESRVIEILPEEIQVRKVKVITIPERVQPLAANRRAEVVTPPISNLPATSKKKVVRETRTARLRRAEKILTGV